MKIGLQIPSFKYPEGVTGIRAKLKDIAQTADEAGFYSLWVMDHFYQIEGLFGEKYTDPMFEAYSVLNYFAALTEKVHLGALVTGVIYRHPSLLLKQVTTLDVLSGGRAYFGVGAAWYEGEATGLGFPYPPTKERFEMLEDALKMTHQLWSSTESSFEGHYFSAPKMVSNPAPLSQPHPKIMIGGTGPNKTLRMVAQYADTCNIFEAIGAPKIQEALDHIKRHCDELGRDYATVEKTSLGTVTLENSKDTVASVIERCQNLAKLGFTHAIFNMTNVSEITPLEIFGKEIIPAVAEL